MRKPPLPTDPVARAIESALRPGLFISYNAGRSFITALEVEVQLKALVEVGQAAPAIGYYELFIAACEEKANEIDDSASNFHDFVAGLFCGWMQAREAAGCGANDTALAHFLHAKQCYEQAGQTAVWQAVVDFVRQQHGKKYGFMPAFERIVQGEHKTHLHRRFSNVRHDAQLRRAGEVSCTSHGEEERRWTADIACT